MRFVRIGDMFINPARVAAVFPKHDQRLRSIICFDDTDRYDAIVDFPATEVVAALADGRDLPAPPVA